MTAPRIPTYYFDDAVYHPRAVVRTASATLATVDFDTIVVMGMSGAIIAPMLAESLGKYLLVARKPDDKSTHSGFRAFGALGERWVFVDDFISTGTTFRFTRDVVNKLADDWFTPIHTSFVGTYQYTRDIYTPREEMDPAIARPMFAA